MSGTQPVFPVGSVGYNLMLLRGTWHDHIELYNLDGTPLDDDSTAGSGSPGPGPFDNLVYIDFDGEKLSLTNVHIRGRPLAAKTFTGRLRGDLLIFDPLGPGAYENVGMSGGPGILTFNARQLGAATDIYMEPDFIMLTAPGERVRFHVSTTAPHFALEVQRDGAEPTIGTECFDDPPDPLVHAVDHRGVDFHIAGRRGSFFYWHFSPGFYRCHAWKRFRILLDYSEFLQAFQSLVTQYVPAFIVLALIFIDVRFWGMQGVVWCCV